MSDPKHIWPWPARRTVTYVLRCACTEYDFSAFLLCFSAFFGDFGLTEIIHFSCGRTPDVFFSILPYAANYDPKCKKV